MIRSPVSSILLASLLGLLVITSATFAQDEVATTPQDAPSAPSVTLQEIERLEKQAAEMKELDDATRGAVQELYDRAKLELAAASKAQTRVGEFQPPVFEKKSYDFNGAEVKELQDLSAELAVLENRLAQVQEQRSKIDKLRVNQTDRLGKVRQEIAESRESLQTVDQSIEQLRTARDNQTETPVLSHAREVLLTAQKQHKLAVVKALEAELGTYQQSLPDQWFQQADDAVRLMESDVRDLRLIVSQLRTKDASAQKSDAEAALDGAPAALKPVHEDTVSLATRWLELDTNIGQKTLDAERISRELERWKQDYDQATSLAEQGNSTTLGLLLSKKRYTIPSTSELRRQVSVRGNEIRDVQVELFNLRDQQSQIADKEAAADDVLRQLRESGETIPEDARQKLIDAFERQHRIRHALILDLNRYQDLLLTANQDQEQLVRLVVDYDKFITARLFWVRNTSTPTEADIRNLKNAAAWLVNAESWKNSGQTLLDDAQDNPDLTLLFVGLFLLLLVPRRKARQRIREIGSMASKASCRIFRPTVDVLLLSLVLAMLVPSLVAYVGWRLQGSADPRVQAYSFAMLSLAPRLLMLEVLRQYLRTGGLAAAHFGWPARALQVVVRNLWVLMLFGLPLLFVSDLFAAQEFEPYNTSLGRLAFIGLMAVWIAVAVRLLRKKGGVLEEYIAANPNSFLAKGHRFVLVLAVMIPLILAVLAFIGYYYTARNLGHDVLITMRLGVSLFFLYAIMQRWVRIKRRRLRWQQAMEYREKNPQVAADAGHGEVAALPQDTQAINLVEMDQQTRAILRSFVLFVGVIALWLIWSEVLPALAIIGDFSLWPGAIDSITVGDTFLSVLVLCVTVIFAKNVPGLTDILVLEKLSMEASVRYAISTLSRYVIVIVGILIAANVLGFPWNKVQWLIAALGVGLGFGLQEIVANFVSGIILLFERPIRVGDVVTLGDTTGIVTKISIRATRVRNWDRQELLIPNRELVTGRIVNWTLTDNLNRLVLTVGVAYGSDTNRVRELLQEIIRENPMVVDDPSPIVTFEQFGDSTLNFIVRAILSKIDDRLEATHQLHSEIHSRFAKEGIEIAFPQRDLHLRSVPESQNGAAGDPARQILGGAPRAAEGKSSVN